MTTLILIAVALFVVVLPALLAYCLSAVAGDADRLIEQAQARPPEGSLQARVDALRAVGEDFDRMWRDEPAPSIRHTPGGWRAS